MIKNRALAIFTSLLATAALSLADDWPCLGGNDPGRNMYSPEQGLPSQFDPGKCHPNTQEIDVSTTKNVKWVVKLGSQSYGNPVAANGKILVGTNNAAPRDPRFTDDRSILLCVNEDSGDFLWQLVVPKLASGKVNDWDYIGLVSSPNVVGEKVYVVTTRCEVLCLNLNGQANGNHGPFTDEGQYMAGPGKPPVKVTSKDADILWRYDVMEELGVFPHNASNCSVILLGDTLFTCTSNGMDWSHVNIPAPRSPSLIALNRNTGELLAEDDAAIGPKIKHSQWSSPSIGTIDGRSEVFLGGGDGVLYAFNPEPAKEGDSTYLKKIWWFDCVPEEYKHDKNGKVIKYPAAEGPSEIIATPVFYKNRVYVAIGQEPDHGEGVGRLVCVDATGTGDITQTGVIWDFKGIRRTLSAVSIDSDSGLLFIADFSGFVYCLDAETGKLYWTHDTLAHIWGSTMVADGKVYCCTEEGDMFVFADSKEKKLISQINMGSPVKSTPIVANGTLIVATMTHLYAIAEGAKPVQAGGAAAAKLAAAPEPPRKAAPKAP